MWQNLLVCTVLIAVKLSKGKVTLPQVNSLTGARIFHTAFPNSVTQRISNEEFDNISSLRKLLSSTNDAPDMSGLPWKVLPALGISDKQDLWSRSQIQDAYEKYRHTGFVVWAEKLDKPEKGCVLLNHWSQRAILLTDYDLERGAKGYEFRREGTSPTPLTWPPLSLEYEMTEKSSRWQAVRVSDNIASGEVFATLPSVMTKAPWELIFLLLLSPDEHAETLQALFDTGLCPRQGLIAYIRLLDQVQQRAESWEGVPAHRKIMEYEIFL